MGETRKVLELVVYKLNAGVARDRFLGTNEAVSAWVGKQPGFISRDLVYEGEGDRWVDVIWWETMEDATAAAEQSTTSESCAPMFALVDMESALMLHGEQAIPTVRVPASVAE